jgi:phage gp36-like protein
MAYIIQSDLEGKIEPKMIVQALDDDGDGVADSGAWDKVYADVEQEIHGAISARYSVPFSAPYPAAIVSFCLALAAAALYSRRGITGDANPWEKSANAVRDRLEAIRTGKEFLSGTVHPIDAGGMVIMQDSIIDSGTRPLL